MPLRRWRPLSAAWPVSPRGSCRALSPGRGAAPWLAIALPGTYVTGRHGRAEGPGSTRRAPIQILRGARELGPRRGEHVQLVRADVAKRHRESPWRIATDVGVPGQPTEI